MCEVRYHLIFLTIINLILILFINKINGLPINAKNDYLYDDDYDYDLIYDQRQKGTENLRINIDGVVLGLPTDDSDTTVDNAADIISELLSIAAGFGGNEDNGDDDDDQEIEISYISSITTPAPTFESGTTTVAPVAIPEVATVNKEPTITNEEKPIIVTNKPNSVVMSVEIVKPITDDKKPEENLVTIKDDNKEINDKVIAVQRASSNNINSTFKRRNNSRNKSRLMSLLKPLFQRRSSN